MEPLNGIDIYNYKRVGRAVTHWGGVRPINNPTPSGVEIQDATNRGNRGDGNRAHLVQLDRYPIDTTRIAPVQLRDRFCKVLAANKNDYNPRKYPDPGLSTTCFPARKLAPVPMNGSVCSYNPPVPHKLPPSGTNDVSFIVSRF